MLLFLVMSFTPAFAADSGPSDAMVAASEQPEVVLYGAEWCGYCGYARRYFEQKDIEYVEYDIEKSERGRRDYRQMGGRGIPIILVDGQRINGFKPGRFRKIYQQAAASH